jgi:hypothetical protein
VRVLIRGRWLDAVPEVAPTSDARAELLAELVRRGPRAARRLYLGLPTDRPPTTEQLHAAAARVAAVTFHVSPRPDAAAG